MNRYLTMLIIVWWVGAAIATAAILVPIYEDYLIVGIIGWIVLAVASGLILVEIRRIKTEDKKKEALKG